MKKAFLGIGSNKGNRKKNIAKALSLLSQNKKINLVKVSKLLKNPPQEGVKGGFFLNGVVLLKTSLSPIQLFWLCKKIEKKLGRKPIHDKWFTIHDSRTIDLDILFYEKKIIKSKRLTIPHPRLHKRYFVLKPLMEIGRDFVHPILRKKVEKLYTSLRGGSERADAAIS